MGGKASKTATHAWSSVQKEAQRLELTLETLVLNSYKQGQAEYSHFQLLNEQLTTINILLTQLLKIEKIDTLLKKKWLSEWQLRIEVYQNIYLKRPLKAIQELEDTSEEKSLLDKDPII